MTRNEAITKQSEIRKQLNSVDKEIKDNQDVLVWDDAWVARATDLKDVRDVLQAQYNDIAAQRVAI